MRSSPRFQSGRLLACIASRPGQCGRADGYVLEGEVGFVSQVRERVDGRLVILGGSHNVQLGIWDL